MEKRLEQNLSGEEHVQELLKEVTWDSRSPGTAALWDSHCWGGVGILEVPTVLEPRSQKVYKQLGETSTPSNF